jgi:hypothetical protein
MLAELAAANAAFAVIKQAVANGRDIATVGSQIAKFVTSQDDLRRKVEKKKRSPFHVGNDFEEFMALEAIREKEEELKQYMIYAGRPGLWNDWLKFQAQARKDRQAAEEQRKKNRDRMIEIIVLSIACIVGLGVFAVIIYAGMKARGLIS